MFKVTLSYIWIVRTRNIVLTTCHFVLLVCHVSIWNMLVCHVSIWNMLVCHVSIWNMHLFLLWVCSTLQKYGAGMYSFVNWKKCCLSISQSLLLHGVYFRRINLLLYACYYHYYFRYLNNLLLLPLLLELV